MTRNGNTSSLKQSWRNPRTWVNALMTALAGGCLVIALIPLVWLLVFVIVRGFNRLDLALLTQLPPAPGLAESSWNRPVLVAGSNPAPSA